MFILLPGVNNDQPSDIQIDVSVILSALESLPDQVPISNIKQIIEDLPTKLWKAFYYINPYLGKVTQKFPEFNIGLHNDLLNKELESAIKNGRTDTLYIISLLLKYVRASNSNEILPVTRIIEIFASLSESSPKLSTLLTQYPIGKIKIISNSEPIKSLIFHFCPQSCQPSSRKIQS